MIPKQNVDLSKFLIPGTNTVSPEYYAERARVDAINRRITQQNLGSQRRLENIGKLATIGIVGGGALGAAGMFGGAAGASSAAPIAGGSPWAVTPLASTVASSPAVGVGAGAAAHGFSLGGLMELGKLGANLWGSISGNRAQKNAQQAALIEQQREFDRQQQMLAEQMAQDKAEKERVFAESQRQWEAQQKFQADQFKASEEDRLRRQGYEDYDQQLKREAEARKAPRRAASQMALSDLLALIGRGR